MKKEVFISKINPIALKGVAHRGYWNEDRTENGIPAFKAALENNIAIELDVHLSKDNHLVVCHDENLLRTTGKEGIIEDLNLQEIKDNYRLLDGSEVPTLQEVLDLVNEQVPIFLELKTWQKNNKELAAQVKVELERIKDKKNIILIAFDPRALFACKSFGFVRSFLIAISHKWTWLFHSRFESIDVEYQMLEWPKVKRYAKKHFVNCWTVQNDEILNQVRGKSDTITFQLLDYKKVEKVLEKEV
ncbi:MAG: hypothetical protein J6X03_06125 [Bacilli bacterium]|nr:hypothetical protein [Bacilli bacterium]